MGEDDVVVGGGGVEVFVNDAGCWVVPVPVPLLAEVAVLLLLEVVAVERLVSTDMKLEKTPASVGGVEGVCTCCCC